MNFSSADFFKNASTEAIRAFQRQLGVNDDGNVGTKTINALNRQLGVSARHGAIESETIYRLQAQLGVPSDGIISQQMIDAFNAKYAGNASDTSHTRSFAPQQAARGQLRFMSTDLPKTTAPLPTAGIQTIAGQSQTQVFAFSLHDSNLLNQGRFLVEVTNGHVRSMFQEMKDGKYQTATNVLPVMHNVMDRYMENNFQRSDLQRFRVNGATSLEQATTLNLNPGIIPPGLNDAPIPSFIGFMVEFDKAKTPEQKADFIKTHPADVATYFASNTQDIKQAYKENYKGWKQAIDTYRSGNPTTELSQWINQNIANERVQNAATQAPARQSIALASPPNR